MSVTGIVKLKIGDYEAFQTSFSNRASARLAAGIDVKAYRDMDDSSCIVVIGTVTSKEAFFAFMTSPEQQEAMKNATVQGPPDITWLEEC